MSDTKQIHSIVDLLSYFPKVDRSNPKEWRFPTPVDPRPGESGYVYNGITFYGEDRLFWKADSNLIYYRNHPDFPEQGATLIPLERITNALGLTDVEVAELDYTRASIPANEITPLGDLWGEFQVIRAWGAVDRDYWYRYGITDETIDHFRLGTAVFKEHWGLTPIIPANITRIDGDPVNAYYIFARSKKTGWVSSSGSKSQFVWIIEDDPGDKTLYFAEGPRDVVSAWQLGFKNVVLWQGSGGFSREKFDFVKAGYETVVSLMDNDSAGQKYTKKLSEWVAQSGLQMQYTNWPREHQANDISDLLQIEEDPRQFILDHLEIIDHVHYSRPFKIEDYSSYDQTYTKQTTEELSSIEDLREGDHSIYNTTIRYIDEYLRGDTDTLQLLATPPGSGKTHALIKVSKDLIERLMPIKKAEYEGLQEQLEETLLELDVETDDEEIVKLEKKVNNFRRRIATFSWTIVSWFGQYRDGYQDLIDTGADPTQFFNFEARNEDNCANYTVAQTLAEKNHDVNSFCEFSCPLKDLCKKNGYLSQNEQARKHPVVYYRHQYLVAGERPDDNVIFIDENPHKVVDNQMETVAPNDLYPHSEGWDLDVNDRTQVGAINNLANAVRDVLVLNKESEQILHGVDFFKQLDDRVRYHTKKSLEEILEFIDDTYIRKYYHPSYVGNGENIRDIALRCMPSLYKTLHRELTTFGFNWERPRNTVFHAENGYLRYYPAERPKIPRRKPIVIADATPEEAIYEIMFDRRLDIFDPQVKNPNSKVIVLQGSDYTKSSRDRYLKNVYTLLSEQETDEDREKAISSLSENPLLQRLLAYIGVLSELHTDLLVVTFKSLCELLRPISPYQNVHFGHYGGLRGTNAYKNVEAALLIGTYRVPYHVLHEQAQVWLSLIGVSDPIPEETILVPAPYHQTDEGYTKRTFEHHFGDRYVDLNEVSEAKQCAYRIRPHSSLDSKTIYVMANRPLIDYVDEVHDARKFFDKLQGIDKDSLIYTHLMAEAERTRQEYGVVKLPTYRELQEMFQVSSTTVREISKQVKQELGI